MAILISSLYILHFAVNIFKTLFWGKALNLNIEVKELLCKAMCASDIDLSGISQPDMDVPMLVK